MPTQIQYDTVKQQVMSFEGFSETLVRFNMGTEQEGAIPIVLICYKGKIRKFCDPDWEIVIKQLAYYYMRVKKKESNSLR